MVKFPSPIADARNYPKAKILVVPGFSIPFPEFGATKSASVSTFLQHGFFTNSGRTALGLAAKTLGIGPKTSVLLPAYHCPGLVEPFIWSGSRIIFYKLKNDLSVDLEDFQNKIEPNTKACLFARFFGFYHHMPEAIRLARKNNLLIIEDNAHTVINLNEENVPRLYADAAICSLNKCYPTPDGGVLIFQNRQNISLKPRSYVSEFKMLLNICRLDHKLSWFYNLLKPKSRQQNVEQPPLGSLSMNKFEYRYFREKDLLKQSFRYTSWVTKASNLQKIFASRRNHYTYLLQRLIHSKTGRPLYPELPTNVCPYVFPFLLNAESSFHKIRNLRLQILRWEEVAKSDCEISQLYRTRLIQIPCHQKLSVSALDEIVRIINVAAV